jgi:hypothetical protein
MDADRAAEQLLTIRQLMERSALDRRALAPAMLIAGALGLAAGALGVLAGKAGGLLVELQSPKGYFLLWLTVAAGAAGGALLLVRTQSWSAGEPFWTPPARRVAKAALPPWLAAMALLVPLATALPDNLEGGCRLAAASAPLWILGHGLALHAAGFHTLRGVRWMGLVFIAAGLALACLAARKTGPDAVVWAHMAMGGTFGLGHLAAGIFLRWSEARGDS